MVGMRHRRLFGTSQRHFIGVLRVRRYLNQNENREECAGKYGTTGHIGAAKIPKAASVCNDKPEIASTSANALSPPEELRSGLAQVANPSGDRYDVAPAKNDESKTRKQD